MSITTKGRRIHSPSHPGEFLRDLYMEAAGVTVTAAADALGVSRKHLSSILNGHAAVTADMALRLAAVFGNDAEFWLNLQVQYDLAEAAKEPPKTKKLLAA
jgi:addiction module HigA family antidote